MPDYTLNNGAHHYSDSTNRTITRVAHAPQSFTTDAPIDTVGSTEPSGARFKTGKNTAPVVTSPNGKKMDGHAG